MVSYSISEALNSGDLVILLVDLQSYGPHLSVVFISDMLHIVIRFNSHSSCPRYIGHSLLGFDLSNLY